PVVPGATLLGSGESLTWTPPSDASGTLSAFTIEAFDGVLASGSAVVVPIVVAAINDVPVFVEAGPFTVAETAAAGSVIGQIDAHDGDGGPIDGVAYSI